MKCTFMSDCKRHTVNWGLFDLTIFWAVWTNICVHIYCFDYEKLHHLTLVWEAQYSRVLCKCMLVFSSASHWNSLMFFHHNFSPCISSSYKWSYSAILFCLLWLAACISAWCSFTLRYQLLTFVISHIINDKGRVNS